MTIFRRTVGAALLAVIVSTLAGCYAYVDDDHYHRRGYYGYYSNDYPRYGYYDRDYRYSYYDRRW
jgi:hypothetical protein